MLRRLDCVLGPTKAEVLDRAKRLRGGKVDDIEAGPTPSPIWRWPTSTNKLRINSSGQKVGPWLSWVAVSQPARVRLTSSDLSVTERRT